MKYKLVFLCVGFMLAFVSARAQGFDREGFYAAMASSSLERVNDEIAVVKASSVKEKDAYEGALLMKKAGLLKIPAEKLRAFKAGRIRFEPAIVGDPENAEYHFLRLTIQEHAPKIVKYDKDIESDKGYIQKGYKELLPVVQKAILDYSKTSKVLHQSDL